jgi:hypothetical protein
MQDDTFYTQVRELLDGLFLSTGFELDLRLTGYRIADATHVNIDPAMEAIVRTEHRISPKMMVDLRELVNIAPPNDAAAPKTAEEEDGRREANLFVTFTAKSAQFLGGNATAFGIYFTYAQVPLEEQKDLDAGIFIPGAQVVDAYRLVVFLRTPSGEVSLARTGVVIGLDQNARLVSYQAFQFNPGLTITRHAPSTLSQADPQVMLYVFLSLSVFMMVNQGEAPVRRQNEKTLVIG